MNADQILPFIDNTFVTVQATALVLSLIAMVLSKISARPSRQKLYGEASHVLLLSGILVMVLHGSYEVTARALWGF